MPNKPLKMCNRPGCNALTRSRYCDKHTAVSQEEAAARNRHYDEHVRQQRDRKYTEFYHSKAWNIIRAMALTRDNGLCVHCHMLNKITLADTVHHKIAIKQGWSKRLDLDNLISLCYPCHNKIEGRGV